MAIRNVRIDYTIREGVDLEAVKREIRAFVAGIQAHDPAHRYTSYQHADAPRRFTHVGALTERVADLQAQPFFGAFTAFIKERAEEGPVVTALGEVASTR